MPIIKRYSNYFDTPKYMPEHPQGGWARFEDVEKVFDTAEDLLDQGATIISQAINTTYTTDDRLQVETLRNAGESFLAQLGKLKLEEVAANGPSETPEPNDPDTTEAGPPSG